jgi:hypothetical protein
LGAAPSLLAGFDADRRAGDKPLKRAANVPGARTAAQQQGQPRWIG